MFIKLKTGNKKYLKQLSDELLVDLYKNKRENSALEELFNRYTHLVYGVCLKYFKDSEQSKDAVMEIFGLLIEKLPQTKITNFKGWIYTVAKNYCLMQIRKQSTIRKFKEETLQNFASEIMESSTEMHHLNNRVDLTKQDVLNKAIGNLKKEQEICIRMMYLEEKSYKEIADNTGFSLKLVKSFIQNGKRNLKIFLLNENGKGQ